MLDIKTWGTGSHRNAGRWLIAATCVYILCKAPSSSQSKRYTPLALNMDKWSDTILPPSLNPQKRSPVALNCYKAQLRNHNRQRPSNSRCLEFESHAKSASKKSYLLSAHTEITEQCAAASNPVQVSLISHKAASILTIETATRRDLVKCPLTLHP